ncbi:nickel-dependent hydrogenase large subunit [Klebsiella pneumoniae]|nr:nickel-dependent hydrogenase large subunit [Klebsiella pneumoniae]
MGYNEVTFLSDRVCGICGFAHSTAYTTSVENAMGIVVPERAQMIAPFCWRWNACTRTC